MHRRLAAVLVCIASGASAADDGAGPSALHLSLNDALRLATERAPAVLLARRRVDIARGDLLGVQPWWADNPVINAGAAARVKSTGVGLDGDVSLSQALEWGGQQGARRDGAHSAVQSAIAASDDVARMALRDVGEAFVAAQSAQARAQLAAQGLARAEAVTTAAQRRMLAGEGSAVDAHLGAAQLARARAELERARAAIEDAWGALRAALGLKSDVSLSLDPAPLSSPPATAAERADVRVLRAERERTAAQLRLAEGALWPTVQASAGVAADDGDALVGGAVSIPIPVFQRGQGDAAAARARLLALDLELAALIDAVRVEQDSARAALLHRRAARAAVADGVRSAREAARLALRGFEAGESSLAELLVVEREAMDLEHTEIELHAEEALATLAVLIADGAQP